MNPANFRLIMRGARMPEELRGSDDPKSQSGWLLYPCFEADHIVVRPGETVTIDCGVEFTSADCALTLHDYHEAAAELLVHPSMFLNGEPVTFRLTNASQKVCVIAKDSFDSASRLGHGIFRSAIIVSYTLPAARGLLSKLSADSKAEGMCAK